MGVREKARDGRRKLAKVREWCEGRSEGVCTRVEDHV